MFLNCCISLRSTSFTPVREVSWTEVKSCPWPVAIPQLLHLKLHECLTRANKQKEWKRRERGKREVKERGVREEEGGNCKGSLHTFVCVVALSCLRQWLSKDSCAWSWNGNCAPYAAVCVCVCVGRQIYRPRLHCMYIYMCICMIVYVWFSPFADFSSIYLTSRHVHVRENKETEMETETEA